MKIILVPEVVIGHNDVQNMQFVTSNVTEAL